MTTFTTGRQAEAAAADYLESQGFRVIEQNYRTRWCEIDIVAKKAEIVYLVEVKYRKTDDYGAGLEYITAKKLRQMSFAAELWLTDHSHTGGYQLAGIEVSGTDFTITNFIESLTD
ncbi:MAG TPA: YraN family protein [Candidatus Microsaccharimonas sp.]|nr:YraN family protein [Candidatus Microsaccharimonas sp.]